MKKIIILFVLIMSSGKSNFKKNDVIKSENINGLNFNLIAHRGGIIIASTNSENSLEALNEAINRKYEMVEIDIRSTEDGIPIIHHDSILDNINKKEAKLISSLSFEEIQNVKNKNNSSLPYSLQEFAEISNGYIGFLLDFKDDYADEFYEKCIEILRKNNIFNIKIAWSKKAKYFFNQRNFGKIGLNYSDFERASLKSAFSKDNFFLLVSVFDCNKDLINKAIGLDVEIVVSVNKWGYEQRGIYKRLEIKKDIEKMVGAGVRTFLIDSDFESLFRKPLN